MKKLYYLLIPLLLLAFNFQDAEAQIFEPEGLNMPGAWDDWSNPPNNDVLRSENQNSGQVTVITTGTRRWQTMFSVAESGGDLTGGNYNFLFTSGPENNPWNNGWRDVNVNINELQTYSLGGDDNNITLTNDRFYVVNWRDSGYNPTSAIFMEFNAEPATFESITQNPVSSEVDDSEPVLVTVEVNTEPAAGENIYLWYTIAGTSTVVPVSFTGTTGTASIPAQDDGVTVNYRLITSSVALGNEEAPEYYWMRTARFSDNFSYTVSPNEVEDPPVLSTPGDNAIDVSSLASFAWEAVDFALDYEIEIATNLAFTEIVLAADEIDALTFQVPDGSGLRGETEYFWRVRGVNTEGPGPWSGAFSFETVVNFRVHFNNTDDWDDVYTYAFTPGVYRGWSGELMEGPVDGWYYYDIPTTFSQVIFNNNAGSQTADLNRNTDGWYDQATGTWFDENPDETLDPPGVVTLTGPENGSTDLLREVTFEWEPEPDAATYEIQVSTSSDFESVIHWNSGITEPAATLLVPFGESLFWRVRGVNAADPGPWSATWGFSTIEVDYAGSETSGFAGPVGRSGMNWELDGSTVTVTFYKGTDGFNNELVLYLSTGHDGRSVIDSEVNDGQDDLRRAISSAGGDGSVLTFPTGFEATHAIGINTGFGGLWEIPATGTIGDDELIFRSAVNSTLDDPDDAQFEFSFDLNELFADGRQISELNFVGIYLNGGNGFTSNEGYGGVFPPDNIGSDGFEFTDFETFTFPSNTTVLNNGRGWYLLSPMTTVNIRNLAALSVVQGVPNGIYDDQDPNLFVGYSGTTATAEGPPRLVNGWLVPDDIAQTAQGGVGFLWFLFDEPREDVPESGELPLDLLQVGEPFTGPQPVPLHAVGNLFNMLGNPFNSTLSAAAIAASAQGGTINATMRTYNPTDGWVIVTEINPAEGFVFQNDDADGLILLDASPRDYDVEEQRVFNLELSGVSDDRVVYDKNTMVSFHPDAGFGWDRWSASALMPLNAVYNISSIMGERAGEPEMLTRASFPYDLEDEITLPIHISAKGSQTELTYTLTQFENFPDDWEFHLTDLVTGETMQITEGFEYTFEFEAGEPDDSAKLQPSVGVVPADKSPARFSLRVTPGVLTSTPAHGDLPREIALNQNYPNPFNPTTQISYDLPESADVRLEVYNVQGQRVATLFNGTQNAGTHSVTFDASHLASGVYLYRLQAGNTVMTRKMMLVK